MKGHRIVYRNPELAPYKPSITRTPGGDSETFHIAGAVGLDRQSIYGAITDGYVNGQAAVLMEFKIGVDEFRWVFDKFISSAAIDLILAGIKHDPAYREQFLKPAVPAKEVDSLQLATLLSKALGEHQIVSLGDGESTLHSWEKVTKVLLQERLPADFATFTRKCEFLNLSRVKGKDCIAVRTRFGDASKANRMFLTILEDYAAGKLGSQETYALAVGRTNLMPTKPTIVTSIRPSVDTVAEPSVTEKIAHINSRIENYKLANQLRFLKAGRDEFTAMKEPELISKIRQDDLKLIAKQFPKKSDALSCMRWHLRGLNISDAIQKVNIQLEGAKKFHERAKGMKEFDA
jgi:hypothetical protein